MCPDHTEEPPPLILLRAAFDNEVGGPALVLAQHGLPRLAVLHKKENPIAECSQEIPRLKEGLDGEAVASHFGSLTAATASSRFPPYGGPLEIGRSLLRLH